MQQVNTCHRECLLEVCHCLCWVQQVNTCNHDCLLEVCHCLLWMQKVNTRDRECLLKVWCCFSCFCFVCYFYFILFDLYFIYNRTTKDVSTFLIGWEGPSRHSLSLSCSCSHSPIHSPALSQSQALRWILGPSSTHQRCRQLLLLTCLDRRSLAIVDWPLGAETLMANEGSIPGVSSQH